MSKMIENALQEKGKVEDFTIQELQKLGWKYANPEKMKKIILSLIFLILLSSLTLSQAIGEVNHYLWLEDFTIEVEAPDEAKVNEEFNVRLRIYSPSEIYVKSLIVSFSYYESPIYEETLFYQQDISGEYSKTYSLKSKDNGRILCTIAISYVANKGTYY